MTITALQRKLDNYSTWRHDLLSEIEAYKSWLDDENLLEGEEELRVLELIDSLKSDKIMLALVAEFSRVKFQESSDGVLIFFKHSQCFYSLRHMSPVI